MSLLGDYLFKFILTLQVIKPWNTTNRVQISINFHQLMYQLWNKTMEYDKYSDGINPNMTSKVHAQSTVINQLQYDNIKE